MAREIEKWVTFNGRRIPIFKKDEHSPKIKGIKKPEGNPEFTAHYKRSDGSSYREYITSDFKNKKDLINELKYGNGLNKVKVKDKRDNYIMKHSNYSGMVAAYEDYLLCKKTGLTDTANEIKSLLDKANKVYLQKQKKYKMKKET